MKRILITSTELMMLQFLLPHVEHLIQQGYQVELACSEVGGRFSELEEMERQVPIHKVKLSRNPLKLKNFKGYGELKEIIDRGHYDCIWTNEPVMGAITRLAAQKKRKKGTKILYMVHGFHFYQGAPIRNWMIYYPLEFILSFLTDVIVTINREDYRLAYRKMHAKETRYIHGIGLDTGKFRDTPCNVKEKKKELGIPQDKTILLSVGELGKRKNHEVMIRAMAMLKNKDVYYVICGTGALLGYLKQLAAKSGIQDRVKFPGYRKDTAELCRMADVFAHPSRREGLGISALEAMASGLPVIASDINGIRDYMEDGRTGYLVRPSDVSGYARALSLLSENKELREKMGASGQKMARRYDIHVSMQEVEAILAGILGNGGRQ